ncbi:uncharacterized protein LOC121235354 [Juglans microcarpa x Juglans regia]|uniref:uncharacterized protein LOC121235354 n=1 Tax=Juglans microcarpa x Juglans regia TaxID=2249226 RepID=UPI001B7E3FBA|nr:uncharacterized protein LOC121235354 [Juglans microcarpa x Juglans regia]
MEDGTPKSPMAETSSKIIRRSVYTFLQRYHYFTSTAALLAFPFSVSVLLSQAYVPSSSTLLPTIYNRLRTLFDAAGFPSSLEFFTVLNQKLSETIFSSILTLPFTLTFLLITKASIIQALKQNKPTFPPTFSSVLTLYNPLLLTHFCNSLLILSVNATLFFLLFFAFNCFQGFGFSSPNFLLLLSAAGTVLYSIILANAIIVCNLAMVVSGIERCGGYMTILKACVLMRGRTSTALSLALPINMALAAVEALFQYRIVRAYHFAEKLGSSMVFEGIFIAYLYSIFVVLDTIVNCMFFKSCKKDSASLCCSVEIAEVEGDHGYAILRTKEELIP